MKKEILSQIYNYKYNGNYLDNHRGFISIIKDVAANIDVDGMSDIGIHLALESRDLRIGMCYSKAYELANDLHKEIREETEKLVNKLPEYIKKPLSLINNDKMKSRAQINEQPFESWILTSEPWKYYVLETPSSTRLFINDLEGNLNLEIETSKYFQMQIKKEDKRSFELIYSTINAWRMKNWLMAASK